ncbi:hypothetical protein AGMMS4956_18790 [Bacteroidia bacterium]|nr:hypothetical protein AGMMS4956_18790 [Bacteroidia bacterium]
MKIATTKERILQFVEYQGISKQKFFQQTGLRRGFLDADKLKTSVPDTFVANIIATFPEIDAEWLLTGRGNMLKNENECGIAETNQLRNRNEILERQINTLIEALKELTITTKKLRQTEKTY